jgi:hypothetical protein
LIEREKLMPNEVAYDDRYANWDGSDRCCYCLDTGLVTVALRDPTPATINRSGKPVQMPTALMRAWKSSGVTHGRHCPCSACAAEDWADPELAPCGMHGSSCPRVYAPVTVDEVGLRYEEEGPCPMCQIGYRVEFPPASERLLDPRPGPWGRDGYWRGRDAFDVNPLEKPGSKPLPKPENARRMRELAERVAGIGRPL